jgi:uncharacterized RDD family membrane protein YckC
LRKMSEKYVCPVCKIEFNADVNVDFCPKCGANFRNPNDVETKLIAYSHAHNTDLIYTSFWKRFGAYLLDIAIVITLYSLINRFVLPLSLNLGRFSLPIRIGRRISITQLTNLLNRIIIISFFEIFYFVILGIFTKNQSLGKYILGIRAVDQESHEKKMKFSWILLQNIIKGILVLLVIDFILEGFRPGETKIYRYTQKAANYYVVSVRKGNNNKKSELKTVNEPTINV